MGAGSSCRSDFFNLTCLSPLPFPLVCRDVALSGRVQEPSVRLSLLEFAALHCSLEELEGVLHAHSLVEVEVGAAVGLGGGVACTSLSCVCLLPRRACTSTLDFFCSVTHSAQVTSK